MGDMGDIFRDLKEHNRLRREKNMANNKDSLQDRRWTRHTEWHYQTSLLGSLLDFWPSKNKWRWEGRTYGGNVFQFIRKRESDGGKSNG